MIFDRMSIGNWIKYQNERAAIENGPHIFSVSEDVPEEFRTVNGYVSNDY